MLDKVMQLEVNLKNLLWKLGIKSASPFGRGITPEDLENIMIEAKRNFGHPNTLFMSKETMDAFRKAFED